LLRFFTRFISLTFSGFADTFVGRIFRFRCLAQHQGILAGIGAVAIGTPLLPMRQFGQRLLVMDIGRRHHGAVRQAALAVHTNMQRHAEIPLPASPSLVHLGITLPVGVPGRTRRGNNSRIDNRTRLKHNAATLQYSKRPVISS